jgi:hypothetical protein
MQAALILYNENQERIRCLLVLQQVSFPTTLNKQQTKEVFSKNNRET